MRLSSDYKFVRSVFFGNESSWISPEEENSARMEAMLRWTQYETLLWNCHMLTMQHIDLSKESEQARGKFFKTRNFAKFMVNHSYNFMKTEGEIHIQNVERMWSSLNGKTRHQSTVRHQINSYLTEFMWHKLVRTDSPFDRLLEATQNCNI